MTFDYDQRADALDIRLGDTLVARTEQIDPGTLVDLDEHGRIVSIEVIRPARRWPLDEILDRFEIAEVDAHVLRDLWSAPDRYPFAEPTGSAAGAASGELLPA